MKPSFPGVRAGLALLCLLAAPSARALLISESFTLGGSASVTDEKTSSGATTVSGSAMGSDSFAQFDADAGVLMGAELAVATSTLSQTLDGKGSGGSGTRTATGAGSATVTISAPGASLQVAQGNLIGNCSSNGGNCLYSVGPQATNPPLPSPGSSAMLDAYVGTGSANVNTTGTLSVLSGGTKNNVSTTYTVGWSGTGTVTYDYLLHAVAGLSSLTLDFGTVFVDDDDAILAFDIFNMAGDRVGLDLDGFDAFAGPFSSTLASFAGLGAGASAGFQAMMDTSAAGIFSASYRLFFSDADVGAASSRRGQTIELTLTGTVAAASIDPLGPQVTAVPEPGLLALLGVGLAALGVTRRRAGPSCAG
jgi:PEP-CTERM motif-containing protein